MSNLENRFYGPDSTQEEVDAIRSHVEVLDNRIVLVKELPVASPFSIDTVFDRINEVTKEWDSYYLITVFPAGAEVGAEVRAQVKKRFTAIKDRVRHLAMVTDGNMTLNISFRFVAVLTRYWKYSINKTQSDALERVYRMVADNAS